MVALLKEQDLYILSVVAGVGTWVRLHNTAIRGDYAAFALLAAVGLLHAFLYFVDPPRTGTTPTATFCLVTTFLASLSLCTVGYRLSPFHPLYSFPGPWFCKFSGLWLSYVSYTGKRYVVLDRLHSEYGPFLRTGPDTLSVNSPSAAGIYLRSDKTETYRYPGHDFEGVALFFKSGQKDAHRIRRKIWSAFFTTASLSRWMPEVEQRTWQFIQCLERRKMKTSNGVVNVEEALFHWSYDLMGDLVFGGCNKLEFMVNGDPECHIRSTKTATALLDSVGLSTWLLDILWHIPFTRDMHALVKLAAQMMRTRVKADLSTSARDLTSYWLEANVPQKDLELDAMVAMVGGSDNTSITLSYALYHLIANPQYFERLRQELDTAFADPAGPLDTGTLADLPFLNSVIHEALRLGSPYYLPRTIPAGGMMIDDRFVPEGTGVALAAYSQQISPENFSPAPLNFHPERWLDGGLGPGTVTNRAMLASFSFGEHSCIGKPMAYLQMRYALARIVLNCDFSFPEGFDVKGFPDGLLNMRTTFMKQPLLLIPQKRRSKA